MDDQNLEFKDSNYWRSRHRWWKEFKKKFPKFISGLKVRHPELFSDEGKPAVIPEIKAEDPSPVLKEITTDDPVFVAPEEKVELPPPVLPKKKVEVAKPVPKPEEDEYVKSAKRVERRQVALLNLKLGQIWEIPGANSLTDPHFVIVTDCDPDLKQNHKGTEYWEIRVIPIDVGDPFHFIADGDFAISADDKYNPFRESLVVRLWNEQRMLASDLRKPVTEISIEAYFFTKLILKPQLPTPQQSQIATCIEWGRPPTDALWEFRTKKYLEFSRMREKFSRFETDLVKVFKSTKVS